LSERRRRRPRELRGQAPARAGRAVARGRRSRRARRVARRRVLARALPLLARRERLRWLAANPTQHHRRPRPLASAGLMDLQLTKEQQFLRETVGEMTRREAGDQPAVPPEAAERLWRSLAEFGALEVGEGLGAV